MQCRHEQDVVSVLELVGLFAFKLPVRIVDEDKDARSSICQFISLVCKVDRRGEMNGEHAIDTPESPRISQGHAKYQG